MRHTALIRTGKNVSQVVLRALSFANSEPRGPVYCYAGREATEEHLDEKEETTKLGAMKEDHWLEQYNPVERSALSPRGMSTKSTEVQIRQRLRHFVDTLPSGVGSCRDYR